MRGAVPALFQYVFMAWFLTKKYIRLYGAVRSSAQGQLELLPYTVVTNECSKSHYFIRRVQIEWIGT
jgi:hypothetical protein